MHCNRHLDCGAWPGVGFASRPHHDWTHDGKRTILMRKHDPNQLVINFRFSLWTLCAINHKHPDRADDLNGRQVCIGWI